MKNAHNDCDQESLDAAKPGETPVLDEKDSAIFATQEIKIEEMAIDGICGVY